jgi:hypothetical protein
MLKYMSVASVGITQEFVNEVKALIAGGGGGVNLDVKGQVKLYDSADVQQGYIQGLPDSGGEVEYQANNQILLTAPLIGVQGHMDLYPTGSSVAKGYIETKSGGLIIGGDPVVTLKPIVSVQDTIRMVDSGTTTQGTLFADSAGALSLTCPNTLDLIASSINTTDINVHSSVILIDTALTSQCTLFADTTGLRVDAPTQFILESPVTIINQGLTTDTKGDISTGGVTHEEPITVAGYSLNNLGNRLGAFQVISSQVSASGPYADGEIVQILLITGTYGGTLSIFDLFIEATTAIIEGAVTIEMGTGGVSNTVVGQFPAYVNATTSIHVYGVVAVNSSAGDTFYVSCSGAGAWSIGASTNNLVAMLT